MNVYENQQAMCATYFIQDAIQYILFKEDIVWTPHRCLYHQQQYSGIPDTWKFNYIFAGALEQAAIRFRQRSEYECNFILSPLTNVLPFAQPHILRYEISRLISKFDCRQCDNFFAFMTTVIIMIKKLYGTKEHSLIDIIVQEASKHVTRLVPGRTDIMFSILHSLSLAFLTYREENSLLIKSNSSESNQTGASQSDSHQENRLKYPSRLARKQGKSFIKNAFPKPYQSMRNPVHLHHENGLKYPLNLAVLKQGSSFVKSSFSETKEKVTKVTNSHQENGLKYAMNIAPSKNSSFMDSNATEKTKTERKETDSYQENLFKYPTNLACSEQGPSFKKSNSSQSKVIVTNVTESPQENELKFSVNPILSKKGSSILNNNFTDIKQTEEE